MAYSEVTEQINEYKPMSVIGLGGGCHWCTEGVFKSLLGVENVNQGWIASAEDSESYSEAIEVRFNESIITLHDLINIHLHTHAATSNHSMRQKYRSAIYVYDEKQHQPAMESLSKLSLSFDKPVITQVYRFADFRQNKTELLNYFYTSPTRPFCKTYIHPKLKILLSEFKRHVDTEKLTKAGIDAQSL